MKVLIIEDDKIILNSLKEYLENWEYEVFTNSGIDIMEDVKNIKARYNFDGHYSS